MVPSISFEEFRELAPRIAVYVSVAYVAIRVVRFGISQVSNLISPASKTR